MTTRGERVAIGAGAAACVACCIGPITGFLAAIGLGTLTGAALFGALGALVVAVVGLTWLVVRRRADRRRAPQAAASTVTRVELSPTRRDG